MVVQLAACKALAAVKADFSPCEIAGVRIEAHRWKKPFSCNDASMPRGSRSAAGDGSRPRTAPAPEAAHAPTSNTRHRNNDEPHPHKVAPRPHAPKPEPRRPRSAFVVDRDGL